MVYFTTVRKRKLSTVIKTTFFLSPIASCSKVSIQIYFRIIQENQQKKMGIHAWIPIFL